MNDHDLLFGVDIPDPDRRRSLIALLATLAAADAAQAQDAALVQPRAYRVAFENDLLRVVEFNSKPGMGLCGTGMHSHPPHLVIALTAMAKVKSPDGRTTMRETKVGDVFWHEAETHEVENISGVDVRGLLVELKAGLANPKS